MQHLFLFIQFFLRDPLVVACLIVSTAILVVLLHKLCPTARGRNGWLLIFFTSVSIAAIISFTWLPGSSIQWNPGAFSQLFRSPFGGLTTWTSGSDGPLNLLLYVPAGFFIAVWRPTLRHAIATLIALGLLSFATELWQGLVATRSSSLQDVSANTIGALFGIVIGVVARRVLSRAP